MKRKKAAVVPVAEMEQPVSTPAGIREGSPLDTVWVCLFSVLLFVSMTIQTGRMALILAALALVLSIGKGPLRRLRERLSLPVLGLVAFAVMNGLAAIYSSFGSYAVSEFYKIFAAVSLAVILLVRFDRRHVRGLLWGLCTVCAVISLLCIDLSSAQILFNPFSALMAGLGSNYSNVIVNSMSDRANGIYNDANISGAILGLSTLVGLYLAGSTQKAVHRLLAYLLLGISAMGMLISMSRGGLVCFVLAALVYLAAVGKKKRVPLFLLMVGTGISTLLLGFLAMGKMFTPSILPDLLALACGPVIFVLDWGLGSRMTAILERHLKLFAIGTAGLVVLCAGFLVVALRTTGPAVMSGDALFIRTLELPAGEYTISADADPEVHLEIRTFSEAEIMKEEGTWAYSGEVNGASFCVPEDTKHVRFYFSGPEGAEVRQVRLSDGTEVPLAFRYLPEMVGGRLQGGLTSDYSFLMRVEYDKDAWKLFTQSPLIGHGLGSTEGLYTSVQRFYYESLYVHNHILQVMSDMGLLGLAAFLLLLLGSAWLMIRHLKGEDDAVAAMLLACWVMMNTHSLMEINFSVRAFQCVALPLLMLPVLLWGKPGSGKAASRCAIVLNCVLCLYLAVFGGLLESRRMVQRESAEFSATTVSEFMETMESYIRRDVFDHEQNQLNYVGNAVRLDNSLYNGNMRKYVKELRASGTYTACSGLARYYYLPRGEFEELFACSRAGIAQEASTKEAWNLQIEFYRNEVLPAAGEEHVDEFVDGVLALRDYLETYSQGRLEEIELTEENQAFLDAVSGAIEGGVSGKPVYVYLTQILGYGQPEAATPAE